VAEREIPDVDELRSLGLEAGLCAVGVAGVEPFVEVRRAMRERVAAGHAADMRFTYRNPDAATDPRRLLPDVRALVVGALAYAHPERLPHDEPARGAARVAAYAWVDHYAELRGALEPISARLRGAGWRTRIVVDDNALVDRAAAHRAGLGWWGKNANLLVPGVGSWVVLGALATDAPLAVVSDEVPDGCGSCRRCLDGCPTGAIVAPGVVDARRCLSWLLQDTGAFPREHRVALGDRIYGCDDCQLVCPPSMRGAIESEGATAPSVDVLGMLALDDDALLEAAGRWYVPERDPRYLRRNLLIVLANTAPRGDQASAPTLRAHLAHADPLVRAHAVWAAARLDRHDLLAAARDDDDPLVRAECAAIDAGLVPQRQRRWEREGSDR
jgi:epoxyqueuosine reductase